MGIVIGRAPPSHEPMWIYRGDSRSLFLKFFYLSAKKSKLSIQLSDLRETAPSQAASTCKRGKVQHRAIIKWTKSRRHGHGVWLRLGLRSRAPVKLLIHYHHVWLLGLNFTWFTTSAGGYSPSLKPQPRAAVGGSTCSHRPCHGISRGSWKERKRERGIE